jgi:hypothetical protein
MSQFSKTHAFAAATMLAVLLPAAPSHTAPTVVVEGGAVDTSSPIWLMAQATTPEPAPAPPEAPPKETSTRRSHEEQVETRIKELHQKLMITAAQESQWNAFAQVMRENAQTMDAILKERADALGEMNAVQDLRSYEKLADAHADGLRKLVPAFEVLYNSMSEDQKKTADKVFARHEGRPRHASK